MFGDVGVEGVKVGEGEAGCKGAVGWEGGDEGVVGFAGGAAGEVFALDFWRCIVGCV